MLVIAAMQNQDPSPWRMRHKEYGNDGITLVAQRCNGSIRRSEFNHLADRTR
jgi:hypothetical protein